MAFSKIMKKYDKVFFILQKLQASTWCKLGSKWNKIAHSLPFVLCFRSHQEMQQKLTWKWLTIPTLEALMRWQFYSVDLTLASSLIMKAYEMLSIAQFSWWITFSCRLPDLWRGWKKYSLSTFPTWIEIKEWASWDQKQREKGIGLHFQWVNQDLVSYFCFQNKECCWSLLFLWL